jgi:hypothetical protein
MAINNYQSGGAQMKMFSALAMLAVVLASTLASGAYAQQDQASSSSAPPWSDAVEVVVHAPTTVVVHGACHVDLWKVTRGGATVWVLPTLLTAPHKMDWDTRCVQRALARSQALLLPGRYTGVEAEPTPLYGNETLRDVVSAPTYKRFVAAAERAGFYPSAFDHTRPGWAATSFISRAYDSMGFEHQSYPSNLPQLAHDAHVPIVNVKFDNGGKASRNIRNSLNRVEDEACLNAVLDRFDYTVDRLPRVIEAWKQGNMPVLLNTFYDEDEARCLPQSERAKDIVSPNIAIWTQAIDQALNGGGNSVAAVPINWLLYRHGVLDSLEAEGATISPPEGVN